MITYQSTDIEALPLVWNVGNTVGQGCRNEECDVLLVQFFLERIYASPKMPGKHNSHHGLNVDGKWNHHWQEQLVAFQRWLSRLNQPAAVALPITVNGRVDRAVVSKVPKTTQPPPPGLYGGARGEIYPTRTLGLATATTIVYLNSMFSLLNPAIYTSLIVSPTVPDKLNHWLRSAVPGPPLEFPRRAAKSAGR